MRLAISCAAFAVVWLGNVPARADPAFDILVAAYPDALSGYDQTDLIWKDGSRMPLSDGRADKPFEDLLDNPDIKDQLAIPYPLGAELKVPTLNEDPGRIRNEKFFLKMYGDCRKGEVTKRLAPVAWMPTRRGGTVRVTTVNGVNERLAPAVTEPETLPADLTRYVNPASGPYNSPPLATAIRLSVARFR